jgi:uncharacterized integral membrane protein
MAKEDRPAHNTTADPTVPGPRRYPDEQPTGGQSATGPLDATQGGPGPLPQEPGPALQKPGPAPQGPGSAAHPLERTRLGGAWVATGCFVVVLLFLLFFILGNNYEVRIRFFGQHFDVPLGVALVLAAVSGALLILLAGAARITQMRSRVRKHRKAEHKARKRKA